MSDALSPEYTALAEQIAERVAALVAGVPAKRYLTVREAATYAALGEDSVRALLAGGKLTAHRPVRGRIVIDIRELDALIRASTARPRGGRGQYDRGVCGRDLRREDRS